MEQSKEKEGKFQGKEMYKRNREKEGGNGREGVLRRGKNEEENTVTRA